MNVLSRLWACRGQLALWLLSAALTSVAAGGLAVAPKVETVPPCPYVPGWVPDQDAVQATLAELRDEQGFATWDEVFRDGPPWGDDDSPVFFWHAEERVLGKVLPSWDQKNVGSCVSFGWGRGCQDLMLLQIAGGAEEWPGAEVATEPIYGGSRVEVGGGRIGGDGSVGAWAAKWVNDWGVLLRKKYTVGGQTWDLSSYDTTRCREWGRKGVPDPLEPVAKEHPVKSVALVKTASEAWQAIGSGYPIPVCSNVGFQSPLREGYCKRSGSWAHCMEFRGRFVHPTRGRSFVVQNSWGGYLDSGDPFIEVKGMKDKVRLPQGCFAITFADAEAILRQGDSFAISSFRGFPKRKLDWLIQHEGGIRYATAPIPDPDSVRRFLWLVRQVACPN